MIVRTYGRRNRGIDKIYSDQEFNGIADTNFSDSLSQEIGKDAYGLGFSSQDSSQWSLASGSYAHFQVDDSDRRPNRKKSKKNSKSVALVVPTATLMETQEFGEMMEHTDEINFALDGMREDQPVRIKRASLLSLLAISSTSQQRRLLRTQGMAKTIIDAVIKLNLDDFTSNVAAATLFYAFTSDCQGDNFLESSDGIRFLLKLLKPVVLDSSKDKVPAIGSKLLGFRKDPQASHNTFSRTHTTSSAIIHKVHEILLSCKDSKEADDCGNETFELNPKWIALLAIERGSLSTITLEERTDTKSKSGGNFKEKLRENGGLKAVFNVALSIYPTMEEWLRSLTSSRRYIGVDLDAQCLVLLLKCLKIMENASFLSIHNQGHLLGIKTDGKHKGLSFTEVILKIIKILSALLKNENSFIHSDAKSHNVSSKSFSSEKSSGVEYREKNGQDFYTESTFSEKSTSEGSQELCNIRLNSHISSSTSNNSPVAGTVDGGSNSSTSLSSSMVSKCSRSHTNIFTRKYAGFKDAPIIPKKDVLDPFAFDEEDFEPRRWDSSCDKSSDYDDKLQSELITSQQESGSTGNQDSQEISFSNNSCGDMLNLLSNCLLAAIKVLMNLTNDNSVGCRQIAESGGLESMSSLIALHFHSFVSSAAPLTTSARNGIDQNRTVEHLSDRELDLLVAILGLLVNLVEKDGNNRTRLAELTVSLPRRDDLNRETVWDVITLLCSVFLSSQGTGGDNGEESLSIAKNEEEGQMEAEKMIIEAYAALLLAFLSTQSVSIRRSITDCLPEHNLVILVPVLERFVAFHLSLKMISPETHKALSGVIESCRVL